MRSSGSTAPWRAAGPARSARSARRAGSARSAPVRGLAVTAVFALVLVACGQKPGVHVDAGPLAQQGPAPAAGGAGEGEDLFIEGDGDGGEEGFAVGDPDDLGGSDAADGAEGEAAGGGGETGGAGASAETGSAEGASAGTDDGDGGDGSGGGSDGGSDGGSSGTRQPQGSDRTGVTDDAITLAVHAPVTGAAPLPSTSFEKSRDLYWRWLIEEKGQKVLGRSKVNVIFADDRYEPNTAVQVCRQLASRAFILTGGGGTDQIQACGRFAGQARVPYFSAGVTEAGLEGNPWYFAASMTYKQQGPLLAQYVAKNFPGRKVGAVVTQTPNFNDAVEGWTAGVQRHDLPYTETLRHPKGNTSWYSGFARQLHDAGAEVVFILTSPLDYIRFAQVAEDAGYDFQYVGVGVTKGLNDVLRSGCPQVDAGVFFSPFPALETAGKLDPDFQRAAQRFNAPADDIAWAIWGSSKLLHQSLKRYEEVFGNDLTREDFRALVESAGRVSTGVYPDVDYSPQNHFGGTAVHVLRADCGPRTYRDAGQFRSSF
jgi:ABC-type branched-subunit amino acid transport system substrate-binding protein